MAQKIDNGNKSVILSRLESASLDEPFLLNTLIKGLYSLYY